MQKIIMTDGTKSEEIYRVKSINPWSEDRPGVWSPDPTDTKAQARSGRLVPSVFAGIAARIQAMGDLPFTVYSVKGDKPLDDSDNYKNIIGFMPYPSSFLSLTEAALVTAGKSYWYKGVGAKTGGLKELKYWIPSSVELDQEYAKRGEIKFRRQGVADLFKGEQVLYTWGIDENVEIGPPTIWPLESALIAAQANGAITAWVADYMKRGAVKAMLLMVEGMPPPGEVDRMESWFNRFMSGARGLMWRVFNATGVKPTIVGDGLEALKDLKVNQDLRYEIHTALGTRHLLEDENFATASVRERQFYTGTIMPDARLIQFVLNEQALHKMGYHIEFEPDRLEVFQDNENEQADAFSKLFDVFSKAMDVEAAFKLASEKLDYQFTDEQLAMIEAGVNEKKKKDKEEAELMRQNLQGNPQAAQPDGKPIPPKKPIPKALIELDKWEDKVSKAGKMVTWHAVDLSPEMVKAIKAGDMTFAQAREQLQPVEPETADSIKALAEAINNAALVVHG